MNWFAVDKAGLAQVLQRRGKAWAVLELIQNAWDAVGVTCVNASLERVPGSKRATLIVEDDSPQGFADLKHAYTLFAPSEKKGSATSRGRFNLGEKLALALCRTAVIETTTGSVEFGPQGKRVTRRRRAAGSRIMCEMPMTDEEIADCDRVVWQLLVPTGIATWWNGERIAEREAVAEFELALPTDLADSDGVLRRRLRKAVVRVVEPVKGEEASIYEMGLPVVATGDRWHIDVQQKVPLSMERDNVTPAYLAKLRAAVLEHMADRLDAASVGATWIKDALESHGEHIAPAAIAKVAQLRFGERAVAFDPSDHEANARAVASGYAVVHGGALSKAEWSAMRRADVLPAAGRVTPTAKPYSEGGDALCVLDESKWTSDMRAVVAHAQRIGQALLGKPISVKIAREVGWPFGATFGHGHLTLNLGRLGHKWFAGPQEAIDALLIHEFGHHFSGNHLSTDYFDALCALGAKLAQLALDQPALVRLERP